MNEPLIHWNGDCEDMPEGEAARRYLELWRRRQRIKRLKVVLCVLVVLALVWIVLGLMGCGNIESVSFQGSYTDQQGRVFSQGATVNLRQNYGGGKESGYAK